MREAAERQPEQEGYAAELHRWTHRYAGGRDGIPAAPASRVRLPPIATWCCAGSPQGTLRQPHGGMDHEDASMLAILTAVDE